MELIDIFCRLDPALIQERRDVSPTSSRLDEDRPEALSGQAVDPSGAVFVYKVVDGLRVRWSAWRTSLRRVVQGRPAVDMGAGAC